MRQAALDLAKAQLAQAEKNLSYAKIVAPISGVVAKKSIAIGDHVAPGQLVIAISQLEGLYVTANYRETQLELMRTGQPATLHVDALDADLHGSVESIGGATGLAPERPAARERLRELREGRPAHPGAHQARLRAGRARSPPHRHERRAIGDGAMSAAAAPKPARRYFATGWTGGRNPWAIALVVTMATFMEILDT